MTQLLVQPLPASEPGTRIPLITDASHDLLSYSSSCLSLISLSFFSLSRCLFITGSTTADAAKKGKKGEERVSLLRLLSRASIAVNIAIAFVSFTNMGYVDITLAKHVETVCRLLP